MLSKKDINYLKGLAQKIDNRYLVGKSEPEEGFFEMIDKALEARELIKIGANTNSSVDLDALGRALCDRLGCEIVQRIGHVLVLYRQSSKCAKIVLPK
ncbi:MAG: YhbY family RNA-binding protein [Bacilli bacterium]|nr:YhbY family RNA-binding protein [Bacilli bacterium]